jgi:hypothetical protein
MPKQTHRIPGGHPLSKPGLMKPGKIDDYPWSAMEAAVGRPLTDHERDIVSDGIRRFKHFIARERDRPSADDVKASLLGLANTAAPALILKAYRDLSATDVQAEIEGAMVRDGANPVDPTPADIARYAQAAFDYLHAHPRSRRKSRSDPTAMLARVIWGWWDKFGMPAPALVSIDSPLVRFASEVFKAAGAPAGGSDAVRKRMQRATVKP